jgi:hypothetical protein
VLNTKALKLHSAQLSTDHTKTETSTKAIDIKEDKENERVTLTFPEEFPTTDKALLNIEFQGVMNNVCFARNGNRKV